MTIRELREARGWLQAQLGQQVGVPVETIEHWERGLLQLDAEQFRWGGWCCTATPPWAGPPRLGTEADARP